MNFKSSGPLTITDRLAQKLLQRWVPKWYGAFCDHQRGGFHERLGKGFQPVSVPARRLLTQCRQLATYSHAARNGFQPDEHLDAAFEYIINTYRQPSGGWVFSVDEQGAPLDSSYDLYAMGFVIFAFSHYYRLRGTKKAAQDHARKTLDFIERHCRVPGQPGLCEALDQNLKPLPRLRRHESHMHLLEACLFAAETWPDDQSYLKMADELTGLFTSHFYQPEQTVLSEYYDQALKPAPDKGAIITEPGHYCEWIWLLKKHAALSGAPERYDALCRDLLGWANLHGWDTVFGGIYDELDERGVVIAETKRIWPFTEALKANALMLDSGVDKIAIKARIAQMTSLFRDRYMDERGFWTEWLSRDLVPATDYMPGTTPYHVYFGIIESRDALAARGPAKSWRAAALRRLYALRRGLSGTIRQIRKNLRITDGVR